MDNHTFADHSTYLHRRDTLRKTEKDLTDKKDERKNLIVREMQPFFEKNNYDVTPSQFKDYLDSRCKSGKYNPEIVKAVFNRMNEHVDVNKGSRKISIDFLNEFSDAFLEVESMYKKKHLEVLSQK
jgi:hypothetical protein